MPAPPANPRLREPASGQSGDRRGMLLALLLLALGLAERLWCFFRYARITGDAIVYGTLARNLLLRGVYGLTLGSGQARPTLIRLPGYPLFLTACFRVFGVDHYQAVLLLQIAFDLGTAALCAVLARRWFGRRAGMAALALGALCPFTANYTVAPLTETLVLFTTALAFFALDRWRLGLVPASPSAWRNRWLFVLAFALGYSLLLRPDQGLLAAAVVPAVWWMAGGTASLRSRLRLQAQAWKPVLLLGVLTLSPLVPWTARNWHTFHVVQPLAPRFANDPGEVNPYGFQRWYRTWAIDFASTEQVYWHYDGEPLNIADLPNRAFDTQAQYEATADLFDTYNEHNVSTPAIDLRFSALAAQRVAADPLRFYFALPLARVGNMLFRPRLDMLPVKLEWWKLHPHPAETAFAWFWATLNAVYVALAGWTLLRRRLWSNQRPAVYAMAGYLLLRCALLLTLDNSEPRYTLEFFPIFFVLGSAAFVCRKPR